MDGSYLDKNSILPYPNNSIELVYSSHFFEHVDNDTASRLFSEIHRVLKPGGVFRILVPDFEKIQNTLVSKDMTLFEKIGFYARPEWKSFGIANSIENYVLHWFGNYQNHPYVISEKMEKQKDFFRGPPKIDPNLVVEKAHTLGTLEFGKWVIKHIPTEHFANGGHINTWTHDKFSEMLKLEGFSSKKSSFSGSKSKTMSFFDIVTDRKLITLYHEAYKKR